MNTEFKGFPKIARLFRDIVITEKIDGTNAVICIGENGEFLTGSRTQWITPQNDNHGFSKWAHEHKEELMTLGVGYHFGEWWGQGIQRKYGLKEKRFSLFNVSRWCLHNQEPKILKTENPLVIKMQDKLPECVGLVPVIYEGEFNTRVINNCLFDLEIHGSIASEGFMEPEGIVIYHKASNCMFKATIENDDKHKGKNEKNN